MSDIPNLEEFSAITDGRNPVPTKSFDWKNSNAVKYGVASGLVLFALVILCCWQFGLFSGNHSTTARDTAPTNLPANAGATSPPPAPPSATPTTTPTPTTPPADTTPSSNPQPEGSPANPGAQSPAMPTRNPGGYPMPQNPNASASDQPPLPEDIAKWKKEDYLRARRENHPKLDAAIRHAAKLTSHTEASAAVFIELLKPIKVETDPNNPQGVYVPPPIPLQPQIIESILNALFDNGTPPAKEALNNILAGTFAIDDDRSAVEAMFKCLAAHPTEENDAILLKLLTQPDKVRNPDSADSSSTLNKMTPSELRTKAQDMLKTTASEQLRLDLAKYYAQSGVDANDPTIQFLLQEDPLNLRAQLALYPVEDLGKETKSKLEQYFLDYGSLIIGLTTGVPSGVEALATGNAGAGLPPVGPPGRGDHGYGPPPGYGPPTSRGQPGGYRPPTPPSSSSLPPPDPLREKITESDRGIKMANALWTSPLVASLIEQLGDVRSLEKSTPAIVLASTFPLDSVRGSMYRMLKKRQLDGPAPLTAAGWSDRVLNDPGTLVLVKLLNRREPKKGTPPRTPGVPASGVKAEAAQKKTETENAWFSESLKLTALWCSRFEAAAQAQKKAARKGTPFGEPAPTKLDDFEIPKEKDTKIEEAYQLNWPEKAPAGLASLKPGMLKIQYFHLTQTGTIKKTMTNFKRLMKNSEPLHETENGLWAEIAPKATSASAPRRSVDVLVTRADKSPYDATQKEEPTDLDIHILAIEIADPGTSKE